MGSGGANETHMFKIVRQNLVLGVMELREMYSSSSLLGCEVFLVAVTRPREVYPITGLSETGVALGQGMLVEMKPYF